MSFAFIFGLASSTLVTANFANGNGTIAGKFFGGRIPDFVSRFMVLPDGLINKFSVAVKLFPTIITSGGGVRKKSVLSITTFFPCSGVIKVLSKKRIFPFVKSSAIVLSCCVMIMFPWMVMGDVLLNCDAAIKQFEFNEILSRKE